MQLEQNDEIDLLSLLTTIWDGKWIIFITTIVTFTFGALYTFYTPNLYKVSSILSNNDQNVFIKYKFLNEILQEREKLIGVNRSKSFEIDGDVIVEMFAKEFSDYDEMISVLKKSDFVVNKIKNLNDFEKRKALVNLANKFKVKKPKDKDLNLKLIFQWHDVDDGINLTQRALQLSLINVRDKLFEDIKSLASSLDNQNKRRITSLKNKLDISRKIYKLSTAKKKLFLTEQSKIAKELGIKENIFDLSYFKGTSAKNFLLPQTLSSDQLVSQYYLRGFKAIDKEIELLKLRSKEDKDLMSDGYIKIKEELLLIENDNRPNDLREASNVIINDDINNWIDFNLEFAEIKDLKNSHLYIIFSIIIGIVLGVFGVILTKAIKK